MLIFEFIDEIKLLAECALLDFKHFSLYELFAFVNLIIPLYQNHIRLNSPIPDEAR